MADTPKNKLDFDWSRFTEEDFNKRKNELINKEDWNGPALIDVGAVNVELHDPEYSESPVVFLDYYIGGDTSDNPYSDTLQDIPYGHADGDSIPTVAMLSSTYEEFKKYLEDEISSELSRPDNHEVLLEAQRPTVNWTNPRQGAELYITKLAEKVDLAEQKDRRTWQFVRDNHPGYHDGIVSKSDPIFSDNDVYRSVVAGEMSAESAEKYVELKGSKADFAREFIRTEKEILDDAIESWQPEEADENGDPKGNVPDYVQEFHDVVNNAYFEMDKAIDIIELENAKDKFIKSFTGWELNTTLDVDGKQYDQYFIYPEENLKGIGQELDDNGNPATSLRLVVDIDKETNEINGEIQIDRIDNATYDITNNVESELTDYGHKILDSAKNEIEKYLLDGITKQKQNIQEQNLEKMFDGKHSVDDGNNRLSFRETLDFYNNEDADIPREERLSRTVSRMLYYNLYLPDDEAGEKRWKICDDIAKKIVGGEITQLYDGTRSAQEIADKEAKEKFGFSWQDKTDSLSDLLDAPGEVFDPDGHHADLDHMIHYFEENTPNEGHEKNLEKAVSHMLMFTIDDFKSLSVENYDDITQDGAAAEDRGELCDRIAKDLVSGKINDGWIGINKEVETYSKEIADREIDRLKNDKKFSLSEKSAEQLILNGEEDVYIQRLSPEEQKKFTAFEAIAKGDEGKLRTLLSLYIPKENITEEESALIDKYLLGRESNVAMLRFDKKSGDLYLHRYISSGESKFSRTSLKGILGLSIENAEKAEDVNAVLVLQKRLNELRGFNKNVQKSESKENSVEKQTSAQKEPEKEDVFGDFTSKVAAEYRDLNLFLRSAANVLKQLPPEKKDVVRKELLKRGANTPEKLAVVMRNAVKAKQQTKSQAVKHTERKRNDYGMER